MKKIEAQGITFFEQLEHSNEWYWGSDYSNGDLYEAEESFRLDGHLRNNRVLFIHYPNGEVVEPIKTQPNQYLGCPVFHDNGIINLLVDFPKGEIQIIRYEHENKMLFTLAVLPLSCIKNCYNLLLQSEPFMLIRQGNENFFEIIWPERTGFSIENNESFLFRQDDCLYFQTWQDEPEYREDVVVRKLHTGEILERFPGTLKEMPDGQKWLFV